MYSLKKYFLSLPYEESHEKSHPIGAICWSSTKMHPAISKKIPSLVSEGTVDGHTIQNVLKEYVNTTVTDIAKYNDWSWNSLPKAYLDSSYLSVDKGAISTYFTEVEGASTHSNSM